jgi:PhzF family phenazine biosynthesis protein
MPLPIFHVDAFTDRPFAGNPAAVCILDKPHDEKWMQNVSREMNLSNSAFLVKQEDGYGLRWFTPAVEIELCGHATLASAHILWEAEYLQPHETARFHTHSGVLTCTRQDGWIEMDFPALGEEPGDAPPEIAAALGVTLKYAAKSRFDYLVELESEEIVRGLEPNFSLLRALGVRGVIVTCRATTPGYDFISRFFAPGSGIDEDPVTGSAHCLLAPYWSKRLGKDEMMGYQASARGGIVGARLEGDRVKLRGQAVTILRGELVIEAD